MKGLSAVPCSTVGRGVVHLPTAVHNFDLRDFAFHKACVHNHVDALTRRVGLCVPKPIPDQVRRLTLVAIMLGRSLGPVHPITRASVVGMYGGFRKRRYQDALDELQLRGDFIDARVKMFVKEEAVWIRPGKVNPACRAIQFREATYSLMLAQYIKPIEHRLYSAVGSGPLPKTQFIAKALNPKQRASLIKQKYSSIAGCKILELDASRFDAHVSVELLRVEHACYLQCNKDPWFQRLLKEKFVNRGRCKGDDFSLSYTVRGGRMSGDMDTASSNCVLMACMLALYGCDHFEEYDFLVDGDDSLFFFRGDDPKLEDIQNYFVGFGMEMKIDNLAHDLSELTFCQGRIVDLVGGSTLIRDPFKVMSRTTVNAKFKHDGSRARLLKTIALGELSLVRGCPVLDAYFRMLIRNAEPHIRLRNKSDKGVMKGKEWADYRLKRDLPGDWWRNIEQPVTAQARASFSAAWGIGEKEQIMLEARFAGFHFDLKGPCIPGEGVDVSKWLFDAFIRECAW